MTMTFKEWLPLEAFEGIYRAAYGHSDYQMKILKYYLITIVRDLHSKYPSPEKYLKAISDNNSEAVCSVPISNNTSLSEVYYILPWVYLHRVAADRDEDSLKRRNILNEFLKNKMPRSHFVWVYHFGLLTQEESDFFWKHSKSSGLTLHVLLSAKPIRQFTDDDVNEASLYNVSSCYNPKIVGEFLYRNGYSEKLYSNAMYGRKKSLEELSTHPVIGEIVVDYEHYLAAQNCSRQTIQKALRGIKSLVSYLGAKGLTDCSNFTDFEMIKLTEFISKNGIAKRELSEVTVLQNLYEIDLFFQWGVGHNSFFPKVYKSPEEEISRLSKIASQKYAASDGLAFNNEETAKRLAMAIIKYRPEDEFEELSRYYWMICMSTSQRQAWFLQLEAGNCLAPMLNPKAVGLYSKHADKAGHIYGQFPVLHNMGIKAVRALELRAKKLNLQPIPDPRNGEKYVHLFQLTDWPWILPLQRISSFIQKIKVLNDIRDDDGSLAKGTSHSFRTHLLGEIVVKTGRIDSAIHAGGHRNDRQIKAYLKSKLAQRSLARAFIGKFESGEITGPFFIRIMEILSSEETPSEEIYRVLTTEMPLNEYMKKYGVQAKCGLGSCMNQSGCPQGNCWGCPYFLMTKEDIGKAIHLLASYLIDMRRLSKSVRNYPSTPLARTQLKTVVLITRHLLKLGITQEMLDTEVTKLLMER